ncbi:hypothetical protein WNY79_10885 [Pseudoalteromonas sp. AS84]|uniref:hypothetical protein n=1 Tax=Pseudoalteromonas sp. AS84 TaxID=3135778 RepID=UPI00317F3340
MSVFTDNFQSVLNAMGSAHAIHVSTDYINNVNLAIDSACETIKSEALRTRNVDIQFAKGNIAEAYHTGTFNVSAAAKGQADISAEMILNNKTGEDIRYGKLGSDEHIAELKYYATGEKTAKALNNPAYSSGDKIVPADQLDDVRQAASRESIRNAEIRPDVSDNYNHTAEHSSDRLEYDNVSSTPLSNQEAIDLTAELKSEESTDYDLNIEEFVEWSDIARESGQAALSAAAFSAALSAAPYLAKAIMNGIKDGELDIVSLSKGASAVATSTPQIAFRALIAAAILNSSKAGYCGEVMKELSPNAIGMATSMVINTISHSLKYARGDISGSEVALNSIKDAMALASGLYGATLGSFIIPIPVMGALIGNIIGSMVGATVFQYSHSITLGICVESGWTMFGFVDQDYQVSEDILKQCGFDLLNLQRFNQANFEPQRFQAQSIEIQTTNISFLRRGVIGISTVGYV